MKLVNSVAVVVFGLVGVTTSACATTLTYDFFGSGANSHASSYSYSHNYITGADTDTSSDSFWETGTVNIHSTFVLNAMQYQDYSVPQVDHFARSNTFGGHWLTSYSTANAGSHSNNFATNGDYESSYDACDSLYCSWGGGHLIMSDSGNNGASFSFYDSGAVKSATYYQSSNQVGVTSFDLLMSQVDGHNLVTHIGDFSAYDSLIQTIMSYTDHYDELGTMVSTEYFVSDFRARLTSVNIRVDSTDVPEPAPFILFGLGFLMIATQRVARKN